MISASYARELAERPEDALGMRRSLRTFHHRRPPRGVPKSEFARQDWYDVWFPNLAPSVDTMKLGQQAGTLAIAQGAQGRTSAA